MNLKKILEDHALYYIKDYEQHEICRNRDYVRGLLDAVYNIAEKTGVELYSGTINDLLCRFSNIRNLSELLSESSQEVVEVPNYVTDSEPYLKYIFLKVMMRNEIEREDIYE